MTGLSELNDLYHRLSMIPTMIEVMMITTIVGVIVLGVGLAAICFYLSRISSGSARPSANTGATALTAPNQPPGWYPTDQRPQYGPR